MIHSFVLGIYRKGESRVKRKEFEVFSSKRSKAHSKKELIALVVEKVKSAKERKAKERIPNPRGVYLQRNMGRGNGINGRGVLQSDYEGGGGGK